MERLFELLKLAFFKPAMPDDLQNDISPDAIRGIVGARSHGNVYLQEGLFYTKDEVDEQYENIRNFDFTE